MNTFERIRRQLNLKLGIGEERVTPESRLDALDLDSLDKIEFLFAIEEEFDIKDLPYRDVPLDTVGDLTVLVDRFLVEQHGASPG